MAVASDSHFIAKPKSGPSLWLGLFVGAAIGAAIPLAMPKNYVAETSVLFPSINNGVLKKVTQALSVDASAVQWNNPSTSDTQMVEAASLVLKSRAALTITLREAKVTLPPRLDFWQGDALEGFRQNNVTVENVQGNSLKLSVTYPRAEGARTLCQGLLDYYTNFVHDHRLTNTARTRQQLEEKLAKIDRRLSTLEKKLLISSDGRMRLLGDSTLRPDPKIMKDLWRQRILDSGSSKRVLDEMRRLRSDTNRDKSLTPDAEVGEDWRTRWGSTSLENSDQREESLPNSSRRSDLPSRLEMERVYEETLLLYHSGLLQHDFLSMWESLENFDFEVIDPVSVHQENYLPRLTFGLILGGLAGVLLAALIRRAWR